MTSVSGIFSGAAYNSPGLAAGAAGAAGAWASACAGSSGESAAPTLPAPRILRNPRRLDAEKSEVFV